MCKSSHWLDKPAICSAFAGLQLVSCRWSDGDFPPRLQSASGTRSASNLERAGIKAENVTMTGWWLAGIKTPLKNISWDDDIPNIWKNKTCSKPPIK